MDRVTVHFEYNKQNNGRNGIIIRNEIVKKAENVKNEMKTYLHSTPHMLKQVGL